MKYICEICNKQYATVSEAEQCELAHKRKTAEESVKTTAETKISDAVNAYIAKYKEFPSIDITPENQKLLIGDLANKLDKTFDMLIDVLCGDDEGNGGNNCCHASCTDHREN